MSNDRCRSCGGDISEYDALDLCFWCEEEEAVTEVPALTDEQMRELESIAQNLAVIAPRLTINLREGCLVVQVQAWLKALQAEIRRLDALSLSVEQACSARVIVTGEDPRAVLTDLTDLYVPSDLRGLT